MRLIDADALIESIKRQANMFKDTPALSAYADIMERGFCAEVDNAPTVVEFDGEINKVVVKGVEYVPLNERKEK